MTKTEESKYWHKTERHQFQDELRHLQTRQGRFDATMLHALMVDWRTMPASRMAGVSRPTVDSWKTKLKTHFAQCWRAYERDFAN